MENTKPFLLSNRILKVITGIGRNRIRGQAERFSKQRPGRTSGAVRDSRQRARHCHHRRAWIHQTLYRKPAACSTLPAQALYKRSQVFDTSDAVYRKPATSSTSSAQTIIDTSGAVQKASRMLDIPSTDGERLLHLGLRESQRHQLLHLHHSHARIR